MDYLQLEAGDFEGIVSEATEAQVHELNELQLALVGGGFGDTVI